MSNFDHKQPVPTHSDAAVSAVESEAPGEMQFNVDRSPRQSTQRETINGITAGENQTVNRLTGGQVDLHAMGAQVTEVDKDHPRLTAVNASSLTQGKEALVSQKKDRGHEIWHLAQQAMEDLPATKYENGHPINDDHQKEKDADVKGAIIDAGG